MDLLQAQQLLAGDIGACDSSLFGNERYIPRTALLG
jgi:hypothetical protein